MKIYLFTTLNWVNEHENSKLNKFSQSIGQYIFHSYYQTNLLSLKLQFIRPNQHFLLEFSNFNSRLQSKVCSKLAIEIADVLLSLLLILNCWLLNMSFPNGILYRLNLNLSVYFRVRSKLCHIKEDVFLSQRSLP